MTKFEFLGDLSRLISDLPEEDRNQAMEYYEDYFADAGPDKEQEIIKDFTSPEFIAQQVRESSSQRVSSLPIAPSTRIHTGNVPEEVQKKAIFPKKTSAQAIRATSQTPGAVPVAQPTPTPAKPPVPPPAQATSVSTPTPVETFNHQDNAMRNPIFQQNSQSSSEKESEKLAAEMRTKLDIKALDKNTSSVKKTKSKENQSASKTKEYNSSLYSSPKKILVILLLIITSPITLCILALVAGLFLAAFCVILAFIALGIVTLSGGVGGFLLALLSILTLHIPNAIFALGSSLLLFAAGWLICIFDRHLLTRVLPSAYHSFIVQTKNIQAKLRRFAIKH